MDSPFLRPFDAGFPEIVTDGAVHVLARHGIASFSISKVARWMGVTPSALLNDYSRSRLLEIIVITFGQRWLDWSMWNTSSGDEVLTLPRTPEERQAVQVWQDLRRLAAADELRGSPAATSGSRRSMPRSGTG